MVCFAYQNKLSEPYYESLAEDIGLDVAQFNRDRNSPEAQAAIEKDMALAEAFGIRGDTHLRHERVASSRRYAVSVL